MTQPILRPLRPLSLRERQVVEQVALGKSNKEIAWLLGTTEGTVKTYLARAKKQDPKRGNRYSAVKLLIRDHQRVMAIRLNAWIQQWRPKLPADALPVIDSILADQVAEVLK